jgi:hypothetical protein
MDAFEVLDSLQGFSADPLTHDIYNYMEPEEGSHKYKYINTTSDKHIYIRSAYALNCTDAVEADKDIPLLLKRLDPVPAVLNLLKNFSRRRDYIGVHVRHTHEGQDIDGRLPKRAYPLKDWELLRKARAMSKPTVFISECKRILAEVPSLYVYVAADLEHTVDLFTKELGKHVLHIDKKGCSSGDRTKRCIQYALADILALSNSRFLLGSHWSSFTEVASYANKLHVYFAGIDFFEPFVNTPLLCSPRDWLHPDAAHGTSIFSATRNRNDMLKRNLPTWLNVTGVDEIVLVDWGSKPPALDVVRTFNDPRLKLIQVSACMICRQGE